MGCGNSTQAGATSIDVGKPAQAPNTASIGGQATKLSASSTPPASAASPEPPTGTAFKDAAYSDENARRSDLSYNHNQKSIDERILEGSMKAKPDVRLRRAGVSAEATLTGTRGKRSTSIEGMVSQMGAPKSAEEKAMLRAAIDKCLLFEQMSAMQRDSVIEVMTQCPCQKGDVIIQQGETVGGGSGDNFYVVAEGTFDIHRKEGADTPSVLVQQRVAGDVFGELSLMYNVPRQATVTCTSERALLWALRRSTFQDIQHLQAMDYATSMLAALEAVDLLAASLDKPQLQLLADAAEKVNVERGERVITQGEMGDSFFIILSGSVRCISDKSGSVVMELGRGEYFGERALLKDDPRAVHVDAVSEVVLARITRAVFTEVLGPLQSLMETELTRRILKAVPILAHLTEGDRDQVLERFVEKQYEPGHSILRQGESGDEFFIVKEGEVECHVDGKLVKLVGTGEYFGERALIRNEPRAADVLARTRVSVVALRREDFTALLGPLAEVLDHNMLKDVLRQAPLFRSFSAVDREVMLDAFQPAEFARGDLIFKQGTAGTSFVLIRDGEVKCIKDEMEVKTLKAGEFVGERSLLFNEPRACDVVVVSATCSIAYIDKVAFEACMGPVAEVMQRTAVAVKQSDLVEFKILGTGTFGKVKLCKHTPTGNTYALKIIAKQKVVAYNQQEHVMNEKRIMAECDHPFCARLVASFKDSQCLYMVLEFLPGGELFSLLQRERRLHEDAATFYGCIVMLAFAYLHDMNIIYRDLKPENLLLDASGYMKVVDFGFAKRIKDRTWTLCGTPEYLAPETIRNKGHGKGVDWWSLGILVFEMLAGSPPFCGETAMDTYKQILEGNLEFSKSFPLHAKDLIRRLLHPNYTKRLGCLRNGSQDVRLHRFFAKIDVPSLLKQRVKPPYVPVVKDDMDTSNFDHYDDTPDQHYVDDGTGWDRDF